MISALDSNVLLDVIIPNAPHKAESRRRLAEAEDRGPLILCEAVYSELVPGFQEQRELDGFLRDTGVELRPSSPLALFRAGQAWSDYTRKRRDGMTCPECGLQTRVRCRSCNAVIRSRQHVLADFLIAAHALVHAQVLVTRDLGYYRRYFPELAIAS